ncbi:MAG: hypothetical protein Q8R91_10865 [Candidatus Omnitrophota bacterium]|nr:hypothetical protein [Candidatus Omnitrophota bacterium]
MMDQTQQTEEILVTCYRCGQPILLGQGRYNVFPGESYCSWTCLQQTLPHIAEAIRLFVDASRPVD